MIISVNCKWQSLVISVSDDHMRWASVTWQVGAHCRVINYAPRLVMYAPRGYLLYITFVIQATGVFAIKYVTVSAY